MKCELGHKRGLPILTKILCNFTARNGPRSLSSMPSVIHHSLFCNPSIRYKRSVRKTLSVDYKVLSNIILSFPLSLNPFKVQMFFLFSVWLRAMHFIPSARVVTYVDATNRSFVHFVWLG
jgi:hypothetical protein